MSFGRIIFLAAVVVSTASLAANKQKWHRLEADNGTVLAIDLNSIEHSDNGSANAVVCLVDNDVCTPLNMSRLLFDCHGHYVDIDHGGATQIAPPRSVIGQMAALACVGAKDIRLADHSDTPSLPRAEEYCASISSYECDRVKRLIEGYSPSQPDPSYCNVKSTAAFAASPIQVRFCAYIRDLRLSVQESQPQALVSSATRPVPSRPGEIVVGEWTGKGNGRSKHFHIERGPWEFRVSSSEYVSGGVYRVDRTGVLNFGYTEGKQSTRLNSTGDFYFAVETAGTWTVTVKSLPSIEAPRNQDIEARTNQDVPLKPQAAVSESSFDKSKTYRFNLIATSGPYPTIRGMTDLPEGTKLLVTVMTAQAPDAQQRRARGLPACEGGCGPAQTRQRPYVDPIVKDGSFSAGPFSFSDDAVRPNLYPIRISVVPPDIGGEFTDVYESEIRMPGK
jgi:hypothetical protein